LCEGNVLSFDVYLSLDTFPGDSDVPDQVLSKLRKELAVMEVLLEEPVFRVLRAPHRILILAR